MGADESLRNTYLQRWSQEREEQNADEKLRSKFTQLWDKGTTYKKIASVLGISLNKAITLRFKFKLQPRWITRYRVAGKQLNPITDEEFNKKMTNGLFFKEAHKGFAAGLYYTAVRREELRRALRKQFQITDTDIIFSVGKRLKHGIETPPLKIPLNADFINYLVDTVNKTKNPNKEVFGYSGKTCYNIMHRAGFYYPHFCRLNRITNFFLDGWTIPQVHSWTGLSLRALNFYIGLVDVDKMGKSLIAKQKQKAFNNE